MSEQHERHELVGVSILPKPERGRYENRDVYEKSSDVRQFNLYDQSWAALVEHGLSHLFENEADFEAKKAKFRTKPKPLRVAEPVEPSEDSVIMQLRRQITELKAERQQGTEEALKLLLEEAK